MAFCTPCNRGFKDEAALSMHLRGNKAHREPATTMTAAAAAAAATATAAAAAPAPALLVFIWKCVRCGLDFGSRDELRLHILASEDRHFICARCVETGEWLDYLTHRALRSHVWAKHRPDGTDVEGQATEKKSGGGSKRGKKSSKEQERASPQGQATPLDRFFASFAGFAYDAHLSPEASFKLLEHDQGWADRRFGPGKDAWKRYQRALVKEVEMWFGDEHDLAAWWTLCRAVGCLEPPEEIRKCKAILRNTHVNIVDLIDWGRKRGKEEDKASKVRVFRSVEELREYTLRNDKVFAMRELREYKGGNVVLRHLLRHLLSKGPPVRSER